MSKRTASSSHRGGGGRWVPEKAGGLYADSDAEFHVDQTLAQSAYAKALKRMRAARLGDGKGTRQYLDQVQVYFFTKDVCRQLARCARRLSSKQRQALVNVLGAEEAAAIRERVLREQAGKAQAAPLPKRPPQAAKKEDDE
jgi:hypothetical protein